MVGACNDYYSNRDSVLRNCIYGGTAGDTATKQKYRLVILVMNKKKQVMQREEQIVCRKIKIKSTGRTYLRERLRHQTKRVADILRDHVTGTFQGFLADFVFQ